VEGKQTPATEAARRLIKPLATGMNKEKARSNHKRAA